LGLSLPARNLAQIINGAVDHMNCELWRKKNSELWEFENWGKKTIGFVQQGVWREDWSHGAGWDMGQAHALDVNGDGGFWGN
jgi:hypothetical protein